MVGGEAVEPFGLIGSGQVSLSFFGQTQEGFGVAARAPGAALRAMEDFGRLRAQIVGQKVNAGPRTAD